MEHTSFQFPHHALHNLFSGRSTGRRWGKASELRGIVRMLDSFLMMMLMCDLRLNPESPVQRAAPCCTLLPAEGQVGMSVCCLAPTPDCATMFLHATSCISNIEVSGSDPLWGAGQPCHLLLGCEHRHETRASTGCLFAFTVGPAAPIIVSRLSAQRDSCTRQ